MNFTAPRETSCPKFSIGHPPFDRLRVTRLVMVSLPNHGFPLNDCGNDKKAS
ncbi:MAG: hypothetical protein HZA16_09565 [Nitrospirae bacterium]|nr:hypothetical protein [Nitrospirota bacterium]